QRLDAGDDLADGEGFYEIVVGAAVEADDALLDGIARGQHKHWHGIATRSQVLQKREPVAVRQAEIEDGGVVWVGGKGRLGFAKEPNGVDGKARARQRRAQDLGDANLVFDDQEPHVATSIALACAVCRLRQAQEVYASFKPSQAAQIQPPAPAPGS